MNWYSQFKQASGIFPIPDITKQIISSLVTSIRNECDNTWMEIREEMQMRDLIGSYKPKPNSLYYQKYKSLDYEIRLIVNCSYTVSSDNNVSAMVGFDEQFPGILRIRVTFHMPENYYRQINSWETNQFREYFDGAYKEKLRDALEHEFVHPIKKVLGYEEDGEYKNDVSTQEGYLDYLSQPLEREQMFVTIYRGLVSSIENREKTSSAFRIIRDMHLGVRANRPKELRSFLKRITDILNRIDSEHPNDGYCKRITDKARAILTDMSIEVV